MIHFQHSIYLALLAALPLIAVFYFLLITLKKKTARKIGDPALVKELTSQYSPRKFRIKFLLFCTAFFLCVLAVAGLAEPDGTQKINRKGSDIMIALDVSKSMLASDIRPSRLERAKQTISRIIENSPNDRIGLVLFAGRAYLQMPLTFDHASAKMYLAAASPDDIPTQGTVISQALKMSFAAFDPKQKTYKSVVLISDGEDHDDEAIKMAKTLAEQGIMINTIGIGSAGGAPIKDEETGQYKTDQQGETVISKLNEEELNNIAQAGNGIYMLFSNSDQVAKQLKEKLSGMGTETVVSDSSFASFKQYYQYFLLAGLIFILIEFFLSEKRKAITGAAVMVFIMMVFASPSYAQSNGLVSKGNKAFNENKLDEAENNYREALKISENDATASYNLGNVLYRKEKPEEAAAAYENSIQNTTDLSLKQMAFYNKGVAYQKVNKLPECIIAYKNALLINPDDEDARQNLQRALKKQDEQKKKEDKNEDKDQNKNKQNQDPQKNQEQKPQPSRITKQDAEEKLKALQEKEKQLQDKLHKIKGVAPEKPGKDW